MNWGSSLEVSQGREYLQTVVLEVPEHGVFGVLSGMGGQGTGMWYAEAADEVIREVCGRGVPRSSLLARFDAPVSERIKEIGRGACSAALMHARGEHVEVGHIGSNLVYLVRQGRAYRLGDEHSLLVEMGRMRDAPTSSGRWAVPDDVPTPGHYERVTTRMWAAGDDVYRCDRLEVVVRPGDVFALMGSDLVRAAGRGRFVELVSRSEDELDDRARAVVERAQASREAQRWGDHALVLVEFG